MTFITLLTRSLIESYSNKTLKSCSKDEIDIMNPINAATSNMLMTFEEFNDSSKKTKPLSTEDIFVRMLMLQSGISVSAAKAIAEKFGNIGNFVKALETDGANESLNDIRYDGDKKLRPNVINVLASLYTNVELK